MKFLLLTFTLLFSGFSFAEAPQYEYQVVQIEKISTSWSDAMKPIEGAKGAWLIPNKTRALQGLIEQGWEIIAVVPGAMETERLYIKRKIK